MSVHKTSASVLAPPKPIKKRKKQEDLVITTEAEPDDASAGSKRSAKRAKLGLYDGSDVGSAPVVKLKPEKKKKKTKDLVPEVVKPKRKPGEKEGVIDKKGKKKQAAEPVVSKDGDEDEAVEDSEQNLSSSDSGEDDGDYVPPVHESVAGATAPDSTSLKKNKKYVPPDETPEQRDLRTIFIGNVPSQVMAAKVSGCCISLLEVFVS